jgi:putative flippase GtrA
MDLRPSAVVGRFRGKTLRYTGMSVLGTVLTQVQLFLYVSRFEWNPALSNVLAVSISCVPGYFVTKYWVWGARDSASVHREALAFWGMNLAGLALSTLFVVLVGNFSDSVWLVSLANLAGFGVLWVAKFLVFDEYLFKNTDAPLIEV